MSNLINTYRTLNTFIKEVKHLDKKDLSALALSIFNDVPTIASSEEERKIGFLRISTANSIIEIGDNNDSI